MPKTLQLIDNQQAIKLPKTQHAGDYFNGESPNNKRDDELWLKLVPNSGYAPTVHGELLRAASRIYRDMYRNGGCNITYLQTDDNGNEMAVIDFYYRNLFKVLETYLPSEHQNLVSLANKEVLRLEDRSIDVCLDHLNDAVIQTILTTKDMPFAPEEIGIIAVSTCNEKSMFNTLTN